MDHICIYIYAATQMCIYIRVLLSIAILPEIDSVYC